jgi:two-component system nitrogen regulation sensor histidine kinase NtrY
MDRLIAMTLTASGGPKIGQSDTAFREHNRIARAIGLLVVLIALAASAGSFLVLTGGTQIEPTPSVVRNAGIVNGIVVFGLIAVLGYEAYGLWLARQRGRAAARLHVRIVALFSIVAALPAILVAIIASITLDKGLDRWFSDRTQAIIDTSRNVAQAYIQEHSRVLALDLLAIGGEFNRVTPNIEQNSSAIAAFLSNQARLRGLSAVKLLRGDRAVILEGKTRTNLAVPPPPEKIIAEADKGDPSLIAPGTTNLVGGVLKLANFDDVYLYLARPLDPRVTRHVRLTNENAEEYRKLLENRFGVQVAFAILFVGMALVVFLSAIWIGLGFANRLVAPIRRLISAAGEVSTGNLDVQVPVHGATGDIASLADTFNTMTSQLKTQRNDVLTANTQLDERRRFTEAVLSGVSAGVIGLDPAGKVTLANEPALMALGLQESDLIDRRLADLVPEFITLIDDVRLRGRGPALGQIQLAGVGGQRTLNVQVTQEWADHSDDGMVVTLDDITDLVGAQRRSAWADVARRIAHEIKNPLTPIQLSAERLKRRYGSRIAEDDRGVFDQCTDTIVRQVGDIRRMVDEFSAFARMPKAVMEYRDLREVVREAIFLQEVGNPDIGFQLDSPDDPVMVRVDHRLVTQALTNIVKNATEAIEAVPQSERGAGLILIRIRLQDNAATIEVEDNGKGLPMHDRESLLEPYMTTREKGTGLGLAIVRKVMEEHGGMIDLLDAAPANDGRGAVVRLTFPDGEVVAGDAEGAAQSSESTDVREAV